MSESCIHDDLGDFDLSESYVSSVVSSQTVLNTPISEVFGSRKRHLSPVQDTVKKLRGAGSVNRDLIVGDEREDANGGGTGRRKCVGES